ncbi:16S rRNA (guanine(527)-N(7))-methyltransferase RsmG [Camelliibacillus cellulosilyticus]|uniref:Ribosomal RNA small subunit methyltransferase G n=1 Tax=Camelliibacillus cellulosilyticus TaxID=2174486 RepID=A0ABV9GQ42_9BACL
MSSFEDRLKEKGLPLSPLQNHQFDTYFKTLVHWNEKMNLTAITDQAQVFLKHFYDSITPAFYFDFNAIATICDVGSGAGFPSLPIKILFPQLKVTIIDALKKRLAFLEALSNVCGMDNVELIHERAELIGRKVGYRGSFDVVTARAVARLNVLAEYCLPLTKVGGTFIAMKGSDGEAEAEEARRAIGVLGGAIERIERLQLPEEEGLRHIIFIKKNQETPKKYPRKPGVPSRQPL